MSRVWKVQNGQSIDKILKLYFLETGTSIPSGLRSCYYDGICTANPQLKGNLDHIKIGDTLMLPELYKVKYGETFESIALSLGLDCTALKQINRNITKIPSCETILFLPVQQIKSNISQIADSKYTEVEVSGDRYLWDIAAEYLGDPLYDEHIAKENNISLYYEKLKYTPCHNSKRQKATLKLPLEPKHLDQEMVSLRNSIQNELDKMFCNEDIKKSSYMAAKEIYLTLLKKMDYLEGFRSFMYQDGNGKVTIGFGTKIHDYKNELTKKGVKDKLFLCYHEKNHLHHCSEDHTEPATEDHISKAHAAVRIGQRESSPRILLSEKDAKVLAEEHFQKVFSGLDKAINALESIPLPITLSMIDTSYNVGVSGFLNFSNCVKAIRGLKWAHAAREFRVHEVNETTRKHEKGRRKRNLLRYELAMYAHKASIL